jgi:hypothetical protein
MCIDDEKGNRKLITAIYKCIFWLAYLASNSMASSGSCLPFPRSCVVMNESRSTERKEKDKKESGRKWGERQPCTPSSPNLTIPIHSRRWLGRNPRSSPSFTTTWSWVDARLSHLRFPCPTRNALRVQTFHKTFWVHFIWQCIFFEIKKINFHLLRWIRTTV